MIIRQTSLNLIYPQISNYRKNFIENEDILKDNFQPAVILPIIEGIQSDIPRIILQSKKGHSTLSISLSVAAFITNYDEAFMLDWNKCRKYLKERSSDIYNITNKMTSKNTFVGLITNVDVIDELNGDGLNILKNSLFNNKQELGNLHDISCKLTYVYKEKYYINITLNNNRNSISSLNEKKHAISVSIDVNDRYSANKNNNYISTKNNFDEILEITDNIINNKLLSLVQKGEFSYE